MNVDIETVEDITVVKLAGELDGLAAPIVQQQLLPIAQAGGKILLNMTEVQYMSSSGLRMLLSTYRHISNSGGRIVLVGVAGVIEDTLSAAGFLQFFTVCQTLDDGMEAL